MSLSNESFRKHSSLTIKNKVLFHLAGRACVRNARRLKVFYHEDDMFDPQPSRGCKTIGAQEPAGLAGDGLRI
jgi:hypothetical protein